MSELLLQTVRKSPVDLAIATEVGRSDGLHAQPLLEVNAGVRAAAGDGGGATRVWKEGVKTLTNTVDGMTSRGRTWSAA